MPTRDGTARAARVDMRPSILVATIVLALSFSGVGCSAGDDATDDGAGSTGDLPPRGHPDGSAATEDDAGDLGDASPTSPSSGEVGDDGGGDDDAARSNDESADAGGGTSASDGAAASDAANADAAAANACAGKADGFAYKANDAAARCCNQMPADVSQNGNCGACGITCPTGFGCGQIATGEWGCHCATNAQCQQAGYGTGATCYDDGTRTFCNCQCAAAASTCTNRCVGGATCHVVSGQNYCSYP